MKPECTHCRERFSEYLDGLLAAPERDEVDAHLASCAECRRELDLWRATVQAMAELPRSGAPQGFGARVMARLEPGTQAAPERPRTLSFWVRALPVAAMLLVALGVVLFVQRSSAPGPGAVGERLTARLAQPAAPSAAASAPVPPAAAPAMAAPAETAAPAAVGLSLGRPAAPAEPRGAGAATSMAYPGRLPGQAGEAAKQKLPARQRGVEAGTGLATGNGASDGALRTAMMLKDERSAPAGAEAPSAPPRREGGLVFQQANARPQIVRPPQQVLTMRSADPADLTRRAVAVANKQGLEVTLVLKLNDQADISVQVPADRYNALVAALVDLTAPQSQTMSNTAYAQGDFYRQALVNYRTLNTNRLERQKGLQTDEGTRTDRLVAASKSPAPEAPRAVGGIVASGAAPVTNAPAAAAGRTSGAALGGARDQQEQMAAMASAAQVFATGSEARTVEKEMAGTAAAPAGGQEAKEGAPAATMRRAQVTAAPPASTAAPAPAAAPAAAGPPEVVTLQISILKEP